MAGVIGDTVFDGGTLNVVVRLPGAEVVVVLKRCDRGYVVEVLLLVGSGGRKGKSVDEWYALAAGVRSRGPVGYPPLPAPGDGKSGRVWYVDALGPDGGTAAG